MSDRVAVMHDGIIAQVGTPEDLYDRPCDRFVASFIGESNFLPCVMRGGEEGAVIADCGATTLRATGQARVSPGESVTLATRPERLHFADGPRDGTRENRIAATIVETVFAGERYRYLCQCEGGIAIVLKEPSSATVRRRVVGERVDIVWSIADTVVV